MSSQAEPDERGEAARVPLRVRAAAAGGHLEVGRGGWAGRAAGQRAGQAVGAAAGHPRTPTHQVLDMSSVSIRIVITFAKFR